MPPSLTDTCLVLIAHGSRDPRWRAPFERLARKLASEVRVELGYLELAEPSFAEAVARAVGSGARALRVLPLFMSGGSHVERDLPARVVEARAAHPDVRIDLLPPVGEDARFAALLLAIARDAG